jgi:hypothetical protein
VERATSDGVVREGNFLECTRNKHDKSANRKKKMLPRTGTSTGTRPDGACKQQDYSGWSVVKKDRRRNRIAQQRASHGESFGFDFKSEGKHVEGF